MLFCALLVAVGLIQYINAGDTTFGWHAGEEVNVIFGLGIAPTNTEVYAAGYDLVSQTGLLYYSGDRANAGPSKTWTGIGSHAYDVAVSGDGSTLCIIGVDGIYTGVSGTNFAASKVSTYSTAIGQEVRRFGNTGFAVVGRFTDPEHDPLTNGVAISTDLGATWNLHGLGLPTYKGDYARYGSFPTTDTWYITTGSWPHYNDGKLEDDISVRPSPRVSIYLGEEDDIPLLTFISARNLQAPYTGVIAKTTDGGKHFQTVFNSNGAYSLNQIDCFDVNNCMVVGENGKLAVVLLTTDGGNSWTTKFTLTGPHSLHAVRMISATEAWVSGGEPTVGPYNDKDIQGLYYHTTDGGNSWQLTTYDGYGYEMEFSGSLGYASAYFKYETQLWVYESN